MKSNHLVVNRVIAVSVLLFTFIAYLFVLAPSLSFWDCGEYVAAGASLGVAHPPGNPFYILLARTATVLLPFIQDVAFRINLITPITGALVAMLIYLTIVRILSGIIGTPDTLQKRLTLYVSGVMGALFAAFANTLVFSAVEAEVNMPLLLPVMLSTWLAVVWSQSKDPKRDRLLLLVSYIAFLGIGIHMLSMIALLPVFLFVMLVDKEKMKDWRLWITCASMGLIMYDFSTFLWTGSIVTLLTLFFSFVKGRNQAKWRMCFGVASLALLGFTSHLYIPIRSNLNPSIDENHPATFQAFADYLDRKQYGSESMVSRMLWRRGSVANQFGIEGHMGFGGFMMTQFFHFSVKDTQVSLFSKGPLVGFGKLFLYFIPIAFMFFGWYFVYKRSRNIAILTITLTVLTTVGLVFYMNFADGTRPEKRDYEMWAKNGKQGPVPTVHREVRVRDYFYIAGFMYYGMWMGIAAGGMLTLLFGSRRKILRTVAGPIALVLFGVSPALPMTQNLAINSRAGDRIPYDFAYNLLMSCGKDGILFTNGDNDTFPLWALQEAFGIRKDIRIVNLSLVNTNWYIRQMKHFEPKVPLSFSDAEIDALQPELNPLTQSVPFKLANAGISVNLPPRSKLQAILVQHKMVLNIVDANGWKKPIFFANTVSDDNFVGLDPYLTMEGLVYRLEPQPVPEERRFDVEKTERLIDSVYQFRTLNTWRARNDETNNNLIGNYGALFMRIGFDASAKVSKYKQQLDSLTSASVKNDSLIKSVSAAMEKELAHGLKRVSQGIDLIPWDSRQLIVKYKLLVAAGKTKEAEQVIKKAISEKGDDLDLLKMYAQILFESHRQTEAVDVLQKLTKLDPQPDYAYYSLAQVYQTMNKFDSATLMLKNLQKMRPNDPDIAGLIRQNEMYSNSIQKK